MSLPQVNLSLGLSQPVGADETGVIVAHGLTDATADDAATGRALLNAVEGTVASVTGDTVCTVVALET